MSMSESTLKAGLCAELRHTIPNSVVFAHADQYTAGIPDLSISYAGMRYAGTIWLELKHVTPKKSFKTTGIQEQTAIELASHSNCFYVIYEEYKLYGDIMGNRVRVVHPGVINNWRESGMMYEGYNHRAVAEMLKRIYNG